MEFSNLEAIVMVSRKNRTYWFALGIVVAAIALRVGLVDRQGLWVDEVFSIAMATGHSIEHDATKSQPELGDYVEPPLPLPPSEYRKYAEHDTPPAGPSRVIRAVFLSDTSPPLYYLFLYGWTLVVGTSDTALRLFSVFWSLACFPMLWYLGRRTGGRNSALAAMTLFALAPLSLFYTTEGRMYSQMLFFSLGMPH